MSGAARFGIVGHGGDEIGDAVMVAGAQLFAIAQGDQFRIRYRVRRFDLAVPRRFLRSGHELAVLVLFDHVGRVAGRMHVVVGPGGNACQFGFVSRSVILGRKPLSLDLIDFLAYLPGHGRCEIGIIAERPGKLLKRIERFGRTSDHLGDLLIRVCLGRFQRRALRTFAYYPLLGNSRIGVGVGRLKRGFIAGSDAAVEPFVLGFQLLDVLIEGIDVLLDCLRFVHGIGHLGLQLFGLRGSVLAIELLCQLLNRTDGYFLILVPITVQPVGKLRGKWIGPFAEPHF